MAPCSRTSTGGVDMRRGFTLIELLVVLAIITVLLSISWTVYATSVESARIAATRRVLVELQSAVDARAHALAHYNVRSLAQTFRAAYNQGGNPNPNSTISEEVATIIGRKNLYRGALPSRLEDTWGHDGQPGTLDDSPLWKVWKAAVPGSTDATPRPTGHRRDLENIELLYLALTKGSTFGEIQFSPDRIPAQHKRDTNDNGIPEFVDDWGNPIRFYNWTHRLVRPGGGTTAIDQTLFSKTAYVLLTPRTPPDTPSPYPHDEYNHPLNQDSDDFTGAFSAARTATNLMTSSFQIDLDTGPGTSIVTCPAFSDSNYHPLDTFSLSLIISAGPDGKLGLNEPTEATNPERRTAEPLVYSDSTQDVDVIYDNITTRH